MSDQSNTNIAPMPKRATHGKLSQVTSLQDAFDHPDFLARLRQATPKHLSPDRMLAVCIQSVQKTPKLRQCSLMSLLGAFVSLATVGLEPNTALGHAYLVPFDKRGKLPDGTWGVIRTDVQVIFGYQGLLDLTYRSGLLRSVHSDVVWTGDEFEFWYGSGGQLRHRPRGALRKEGQLPELAYMHANLRDGGESFEVMPMPDVLAVRDATQAYQTAMRALKEAQEKNWKSPPASYTEAPWVRHPIPMIRKTVFRAGSKWLPKSIEMAAALALDEMQDRRSANFAGVIEGTADVITGLDALDDETNNLDLAGSFTGYSQQQEREPVGAAPAQQQQPNVKRLDPERQQRAAESQRATVPAFQAYLVDETGEIAHDVFVDPGLFAEAYARLYELADAKTRAALEENNADALTDALSYENAAALLTGLRKPGPAEPQGEAEGEGAAEDPATAEIPLDRSGRGPDLAGWVKAARARIASLDATQIMEWVSHNSHVWRPFPSSKRLEVERAIADRCTALGVKWAPPPAKRENGLPLDEPKQPHELFIARMERALREVTTLDGLKTLAERNATESAALQQSHPELHFRLKDAFAARQAELSGVG